MAESGRHAARYAGHAANARAEARRAGPLGPRDRRLWRAAAIALLAVLVAFRAAFSGYFVLDDFGMLAVARFLDGAIDPFLGEHVPGAVYYRPLGILLWWLSERAFGATPALHYALNLALHLCIAGALWQLVARLCANRWAGFVAALCFACHPIALGTALWLSDRFDLLALLFTLLGLRFAFDHARDARRLSLVASLVMLTLGVLSKEIALAGFAAALVLWLRADATFSWKRRVHAIAMLVLVLAGWFVARSLALPKRGAGWLSSLPDQFDQFRHGLAIWFGGWLDYAGFWSMLDGWKALSAAVGLVLVGALALLAMRRPWSPRRQQVVLSGIALWLATALLQWPLLAFQNLPVDPSANVIHLVVNARYFHTSLAGMLIALAGLLAPLCSQSRPARRALALGVVVLVVPWLVASQHFTRSFRNATLTQRPLVEAAIAAIGRIDIPDRACQLYLLDTNNWMFGWVSDEAVKAVTPDLQRIEHCLIQTEHTPWYHIARVERFDLRALHPLQPIRAAGEDRATQAIGRGRFLFLNLMPGADAAKVPHARFLAWQDRRFDDVTAEVRAGQRVPSFVCNRSPGECMP